MIVLCQYIEATIGQKNYLLKPFAPVLCLRLVQWSIEVEHLVNAIFAKAWALTVVME